MQEKTICNYPECKCPFDMGAKHSCLIGLPSKVKFKVGDKVKNIVSEKCYTVTGIDEYNRIAIDNSHVHYRSGGYMLV